jgi:hypothetical protein
MTVDLQVTGTVLQVTGTVVLSNEEAFETREGKVECRPRSVEPLEGESVCEVISV